MAESMARPWILKHLINVAETHGANIHDAPRFEDRRKVQIVKVCRLTTNLILYSRSGLPAILKFP